MPNEAEKMAEAEKLMKKAKKHGTKGITNWSPDYDTAASEFEKAAQIYTHCRVASLATEAWRKASEMHVKANNYFFGAKALETLANFLKDQPPAGTPDEHTSVLVQLYLDASKIYALDNKPDRQAEALNKAAKLTPRSKAKEASAFILDALNALEDNDKWHLTLDMYRSLILLQLRSEMYTDVIETLRRHMKCCSHLENPGQSSKSGLEVVIVALYLGDVVLADRLFQDLTQNGYGFPHSKEQALAYDLISAVQDRDPERLKEAVSNQLITFLVADIARMAKKITVGVGAPVEKKTAAPAGSVAAALAKSGNDDEDDDDIR